MTKPNKRCFQSIQVLTVDPTDKTVYTNLDPMLLSAADLEKICRSLETIRATIMLEFARRAGYLRQEAVPWVKLTTGKSGKSGGKKKKPEINFKELEELAAEL